MPGIYDCLEDFGTTVYTVGDGSPHGNTSLTAVNKLSRGNAFRAAELTENNRDALLFIAGGNDGQLGARNRDNVPGSLPEAERMKLYIAEHFPASVSERIIADTDSEFRERFQLTPSGNTPQNAQNAAAILVAGEMREVDIVAEVNHFPRVIGTLREQLRRLGILETITRMTGHPVIADFEELTNQVHIKNREKFQKRDMLVKFHHLLFGEVPRIEFAREWVGTRLRRLLGREVCVSDADGTYVPDFLYRSISENPWDSRSLDELAPVTLP
jgi:hypothetical protein